MRKATFKKKADHIVVYVTIIRAAKTFTASDTFELLSNTMMRSKPMLAMGEFKRT